MYIYIYICICVCVCMHILISSAREGFWRQRKHETRRSRSYRYPFMLSIYLDRFMHLYTNIYINILIALASVSGVSANARCDGRTTAGVYLY